MDDQRLVRCGCNPAAAAASTVFFSLWIAAAAVQTAATVSACSLPNTPQASGSGGAEEGADPIVGDRAGSEADKL